MSDPEALSIHNDDMRRRAEELAGRAEVGPPQMPSPDEVPQILHELRVHQIEMEMQNEELRRAQAEIETSQAKYFDLYDLAPVGYCTISEQGLILEANLTAAGLLRLPRSALLKQPLTRFILPEDQEIYYRHRGQLLETGSPCECELRLLRAAGDPFWARIEATMVKDADSGARLCRAVISDITKAKQAEDELRQKGHDLAEKNSLIERFTEAISHDLKSPLATIRIYLGLLEQDIHKQNAAAIDKNLQIVHMASDKMSRLLDELSDLLRVGHLTNQFEDSPLQEVVKEALGLVAGQITQRGVKIVVSEEPVVLHGDRQRLVEVFQNLVDNAVKFMGDQPAPRVEIGTELTGAETVFFVCDNGIGIEPRLQSRLFDLFVKLNPNAEGSGLGLSLVKRIVEAHGGRIWVESEGIGKGACFKFTLGVKQQVRD